MIRPPFGLWRFIKAKAGLNPHVRSHGDMPLPVKRSTGGVDLILLPPGENESETVFRQPLRAGEADAAPGPCDQSNLLVHSTIPFLIVARRAVTENLIYKIAQG